MTESESKHKLGPYTLVSKLGQGGMGEVHLARDSRLERDVGLKLLPADLRKDPERRERFLREARAVAQLNHPNIATIHEVGERQP
jgi:serine/threonine protein kinase